MKLDSTNDFPSAKLSGVGMPMTPLQFRPISTKQRSPHLIQFLRRIGCVGEDNFLQLESLLSCSGVVVAARPLHLAGCRFINAVPCSRSK